MIQNLDLKLAGSLPVNRLELIELASSWGRSDRQTTNDGIIIHECKAKECYDLSNLDVSQIEDLSFIFRYSPYNGDLSKWNVSSCKNIDCMFGRSKFNNDSLKDWNISNVIKMNYTFYKSIFNGDVSKWDISNVLNMYSTFELSPFDGDISKWNFNKNINCDEIFRFNDNFSNKYNDGKPIPLDKEDFLKWFEENREKMKELNITKEELLDFFSFDNKKEIELK